MTPASRRMALIVLAGVGWAASAGTAHAEKKVTVCHRPPGNPGNMQTISVAEAATAAHLGHGDTLGSCATGCQANGASCDDGNACTADTCLPDGQCGHAPVNCDDGNACTTDVCQPATGCVAVPADGGACDDGNACTGGDACSAGACRGFPTAGCCAIDADCDDGNSCTDDACIGSGCRNTPRDCAVPDRCTAAFCNPVSGDCSTAPVSCDDNNVCTDDFCDGATGCFSLPTSSPPEPQEASCADGIDNDCDGAVDVADADCDACGSGDVCTAADAASFKAGLPSAIAAALPATVCVSETWMGSRPLMFVETCYTNGCGGQPGCTATLTYDPVAVEPPGPADIPFAVDVRSEFDVTVTMPVRYAILGVGGSCMLAVALRNVAVEATAQGATANGGCTLGAQVLTMATVLPDEVSLSGCPGEIMGQFNAFDLYGSTLGHAYLNVTALLTQAVNSYSTPCPVQP